MQDCKKCGGATELREGISKKNGKPWKGYKCSQCGEMEFVKSYGPKKPTQPTLQPNFQDARLQKIQASLDEILGILKKNDF